AGAVLLGGDRTRLTGAHLVAFVAMGQRDNFCRLLRQVAGATGGDIELTISNDRTRCVRVVARPVHSAEILLAPLDVTRRALAEEELREATRRKDEFLAALSHELRNPLGPVQNSVYVMRHVAPGSEQAQAALAIIERQASHLGRLVDDLLDITRIT